MRPGWLFPANTLLPFGLIQQAITEFALTGHRTASVERQP